MKFSTEKPPIYEKCRKLFGIDWDKGIIFTYGDTIHCKYPLDHRPDLIAHEKTHIEQQKEKGPDAWWDRYFLDPRFRLSQEVEAYRNQLKYARGFYDRDSRRKIQKEIYKHMSTTYGNMCTEEDAKMLVP